MKKNTPQRGFTLVELAIVLAIIGIVIAGIWAAAATVSRRNREAKATQYLLQIVQNVRSLYAKQQDNTDLTIQNLITAGAIPSEMVTSPTTAVTPWDTAVTVDTASGPTVFTIVFARVPVASCIALLSKTATSTYMDIGLVEAGTGEGAIPFPPTQDDIIYHCSADNTISWTYNLRN